MKHKFLQDHPFTVYISFLQYLGHLVIQADTLSLSFRIFGIVGAIWRFMYMYIYNEICGYIGPSILRLCRALPV